MAYITFFVSAYFVNFRYVLVYAANTLEAVSVLVVVKGLIFMGYDYILLPKMSFPALVYLSVKDYLQEFTEMFLAHNY